MRPWWSGAAVLLALCGCGSGDLVLQDLAVNVPLNGTRVAFDNKDKLKVKILASAGEPINLYLFKEADEAVVAPEVRQGIVTARVLSHQEKSTAIELEPTLPAKSRVVVLILRADLSKPTNAQLKITAKK